ncbi:MAG: hypothetical protein J0G96_01815 [Flavobacteriia bacterium]|nr:hypothetical protein [Flavobacteriia bacterium]OJX39737.1 MAG: hypothetical protein BGO87_01930 [Flavobacteriia bacterium 40-80]
MKKVLFISVSVFALTSCVKDHTCVCTGKSHIENTDINYNYKVNGTKNKAKKSCEEDSYTNTAAEVTCTLK